ncbi:MAG: HEAT repeat domain-containing protein [Caldilineales bacterium]|nr:HEAT repeat domain-containing protein [Caldilineales bacterium]MDW8317235.1 HEAT repeat domain-containing protein [Anaerolineae bacterium]
MTPTARTIRPRSRPSVGSVLAEVSDSSRSLNTVDLAVLSDLTQDGLNQFKETWAALSASRRRALMERLVELSEERIDVYFRRIFQWALEDADPWVRAKAIDGLWEVEDVLLIGPFIRLLQSDPAAEVRAAAAQSLGRFLLLGELEEMDQALAAGVEAALQAAYANSAEEVSVRRRVLEALAYSASPNVPALIQQAYEDEDPDMRLSAVFAMGRSADTRWGEIVLQELSSDDPAMRYEAARASGELELAEAVPELIRMLDQDDVDLRNIAVWSLGRIGGPAARRALEACCDSDDPDLADAAEEALEELAFMSGDDQLPGLLWFDLHDADD